MVSDNGTSPIEFSVVYEGEALIQNTMDVKDLAPALLSLGQAFERANSLLNGNKADINLQIKAISSGSFDISLVLNRRKEIKRRKLPDDYRTRHDTR